MPPDLCALHKTSLPGPAPACPANDRVSAKAAHDRIGRRRLQTPLGAARIRGQLACTNGYSRGRSIAIERIV
jgi:hypothetical protein